ncbi:MAG: EAL domain-containing protein [Pseudomonadota bacterium]
MTRRLTIGEYSLRSQLLCLVGGLLALAVVGALTIHIGNTRALLSEQLARHSQDTATALGLTISRELAANDVLLLESVVDSAFDPGYFRRIEVTLPDQLPTILRERTASIDAVPEWFQRAASLDLPVGTARVMRGWSQAGSVSAIAHPEFAYQRLWRSTLEAVGWAAVTFALAFLLTSILMTWFLEPLARLERHAERVGEGRFEALATHARSRELRRVLASAASMTQRIALMVDEQHRRAEELRATTYVDPVTGLGNARAFNRQLADISANTERFSDGVAVLVQVDGLADRNAVGGFDAGDTWLRQQAERAARMADSVDGTATRFAGALFGIVLPHPGTAALQAWLAELAGTWRAEEISTGAALFVHGQAPDRVREHAERALREAAARPAPGHDSEDWVVVGVDGSPAVLGDEAAPRWQAALDRALASGEVPLATQPVVTVNARRIVHREVLARLQGPDGELVPAGLFLPVAAREGQLPALDRVVLSALLDKMPSRGGQIRFAVNVSMASAADESFCAWLAEALADCAGRERIVFELPWDAARIQQSTALSFSALVRRHGAQVALDHMGAEHLDVDWLQALSPAYLKLDGGFAIDLATDPAQQDYLRSLVGLAHSIDALLIAEHIQKATDIAVLARLRVDAVQGYAIGQPAPFT